MIRSHSYSSGSGVLAVGRIAGVAIGVGLSILVGDSGQALARECVYVLNSQSDNVAVIDTTLENVRAVFRLPALVGCRNEAPLTGIFPSDIEVSDSGETLYVATGICQVYEVDAARGRIQGTYLLGAFQDDKVLKLDGNMLFVGHGSRAGPVVSSIDLLTSAIKVSSVGLENTILGLEGGRSDGALYAATVGVLEFDPATLDVVRVIAPTQRFFDVALFGAASIVASTSNTVAMPDSPIGVSRFDRPTGNLSKFLATDQIPRVVGGPEKEPRLYVVQSADEIQVLDPATLALVEVIDTKGFRVVQLAFSANGVLAYGTGFEDRVAVIDLTTLAIERFVDFERKHCGRLHGGNIRDDPAAPCEPTKIDVAPCSCPADCNGDDVVTVAELVRAVRLSGAFVGSDSECLNADTDANGRITVDELVQGVHAALNGCG